MTKVYRIYLSRSWIDCGKRDELLALFDALPDFLYSATAIEDGSPEVALRETAARRAALKIAMAQCHVMLAPASPPTAADEWTALETATARFGLRRAIPIVGIALDALPGVTPHRPLGFGAVAPWSGIDIARAITETVKAASDAAGLRDALLEGGTSVGRVGATGRSARPVPYAEIAAAFHRHRGTRSGSEAD
jgi:hypothetical protein